MDDLIETLAALGIGRCHLVGASFRRGRCRRGGAHAARAGGLLAAQRARWIAHRRGHPDLREFFEAERSALAGDDLDGAAEANLAWWVDGPKRDIGDVDPAVRELRVPTLVLVGALDLDAILDTARRVTDGLPNARRVDWADTAHLPSMERPDDFVALLRNWLAV